jgi:hypothetical protein
MVERTPSCVSVEPATYDVNRFAAAARTRSPSRPGVPSPFTARFVTATTAGTDSPRRHLVEVGRPSCSPPPFSERAVSTEERG